MKVLKYTVPRNGQALYDIVKVKRGFESIQWVNLTRRALLL